MLPLLLQIALGADWIVTTDGPAPTFVPGCEASPLAPARSVWRLSCPRLHAPAQHIARAAGARRAVADFPLEMSWSWTPDDLDEAWWLHNTGQVVHGVTGTPGSDVGALDAWSLVRDASSAPIAVVDTGVRLDHEDLVDSLWVNEAEARGEAGVDDDGNGWIDDIHGWGADGDRSPSPTCGDHHGTIVAGTAGASADNGLGHLGVAPGARIMPLRILTKGCTVTAAGLIGALDYARREGAAVVNFSATYTGSIPELDEAWQALADSDVVIVLAAGNDGRIYEPSTATYPARLGLSTAVVVGATDNRDRLWSKSATGAEVVHILAPGVGLRAPLASGVDAYTSSSSGTSLSAPLVAGAVALIRARWPSLWAEDILGALRDGARPLSEVDCATSSRCVAWGGRLDIGESLVRLEAAHPEPELSLALEPAMLRAAPGELARFDLSVSNDGPEPAPRLLLQIPAFAVLEGTAPRSLDPGSEHTAALSVEVPEDCDGDYLTHVTISASSRGTEVRASAILRVDCGADPEDTGTPDDDAPSGEPTDDPALDLRAERARRGGARPEGAPAACASGGEPAGWGAWMIAAAASLSLRRRRR